MDILQKFIQEGFIEIDIDDESLHDSINKKLLGMIDKGNIPVNESLVEVVPELSTEILYHSNVVSAVKVLLGENYIEHPHKAIFTDRYLPNSVPHRDWHTYYSSGYDWKQKNDLFYFNPWNLHNHCRYLHVFYYPISFEEFKRGTVFVPGSQYYTSRLALKKYYIEPTRIRGGGKVVIAHSDMFHMSSVPRLSIDKQRLMVKFILMRTEEPSISTAPELLDSGSGIYNEQVYDYHWNWYHGKKFNFLSYDGSSYRDILEKNRDAKEVVNFIYNMAGTINSEILIEHINSILIKERKYPKEEILSNILTFTDCKDLLITQVNENPMWNKRAAFIDILANRAENFVKSGTSVLSDQWIDWLQTETSGYSLRNLIYGAPLVCQGSRDALNAVIDRFKNPRLIGRGENRIFHESMLSMMKLSKSCGVVPDVESKLIELSENKNYFLKCFSTFLLKRWF